MLSPAAIAHPTIRFGTVRMPIIAMIISRLIAAATARWSVRPRMKTVTPIPPIIPATCSKNRCHPAAAGSMP